MSRDAVIFVVAMAMAVAACGGSDSGPSVSGTKLDETVGAGPAAATITISGFDFGEPLTVSVGQMIVVHNEDAVSHTWTSRDGVFDSESLASDAEFSFSFDAPGDYAFFCRFHPSMAGSITVTE